MAAEAASNRGGRVVLFDAMRSAGRKFLLAGRGGLNLTHNEPWPRFLTRYSGLPLLAASLADLDATAVRGWAHGLGVDTFVGTSGRIFPTRMKAAPLLRAWLHRLRDRGVELRVRHRLTGCRAADDGNALRFATPAGPIDIRADAVVLALGGGSWPRLGSDGAWVDWLGAAGVSIAPLQPSNCGFECNWSEHLRTHFAGAAVKNVGAWVDDRDSCGSDQGAPPRHLPIGQLDGHRGQEAAPTAIARRGEFVLTCYGVEGGVVYALTDALRTALDRDGAACLRVDLAPDIALDRVTELLVRPRGGRSLASVLTRALRFDGVKRALIHECVPVGVIADPAALAAAIKALPIVLHAMRSLAEAISSAGGVRADALDEALMLRHLPGVFCAGEMLDWDAPTGGYLLTAALATGRRAGAAAAAHAATRSLRSLNGV